MLVALVSAIFVGAYALPTVLATSPTFGWSTSSLVVGQTTTATVGANVDADCPSGQTYSGVITVTQPGGLSSSYPISSPCGTYVSEIYPTDFGGEANTSVSGVYATSWAGTTSDNGGAFNLHISFAVGGICPAPSTTTTIVTQTSTYFDDQVSTVGPVNGSFEALIVLPTQYASGQPNVIVNIGEGQTSGTWSPLAQSEPIVNFQGNSSFYVSIDPVMHGTTSIFLAFDTHSISFPFPTTYTPLSGGNHFSATGFTGYNWATYP